RMLSNDYAAVVDIGCAEGYYAVGFALRLRNSEVYAFDTDQRAKELCAQMAALNGVDSRIHIGDFCGLDMLRSLPLGDGALILSDCEGYEGTLFDSQLADFLSKHDVIIEAHDFIDGGISTTLREAFAHTHHIQSVKSLGDMEKAAACHHLELERYTAHEKRFVVGES